MPLMQSASQDAFRTNLRREMTAGKPQKQALAIAYDVQRRNRAEGGGLKMSLPRFHSVVAGAPQVHAGAIHTAVAGRTDHVPMHVAGGSYVLPAEHVSHLGQGNTLAGFATLDRMFKTAPGGGAMPNIKSHGIGLPHAPKTKFASGGAVPIVAAGGEYVLTPEQVAMVGDGDIDRGHDILDHWVESEKKKHINTLRKLPPPRKD